MRISKTLPTENGLPWNVILLPLSHFKTSWPHSPGKQPTGVGNLHVCRSKLAAVIRGCSDRDRKPKWNCSWKSDSVKGPSENLAPAWLTANYRIWPCRTLVHWSQVKRRIYMLRPVDFNVWGTLQSLSIHGMFVLRRPLKCFQKGFAIEPPVTFFWVWCPGRPRRLANLRQPESSVLGPAPPPPPPALQSVRWSTAVQEAWHRASTGPRRLGAGLRLKLSIVWRTQAAWLPPCPADSCWQASEGGVSTGKVAGRSWSFS